MFSAPRVPRLTATTAACAGVVLLASACSEGGGGDADGDWSPERPIELIAPAEAGGGWDQLARTTSRVLEENDLVDNQIQVENQPGGGGSVAWAGIANTPDDPHRLFVTSPPIIFVPLSGEAEHNHEDFTPIAMLATEYMTYAVPDDSPLETFDDLVDAVADDPESMSIGGGSSPGSMDHVALAGAVDAAGGDPGDLNYVAFDGGGEAMTSMLGGHLEAAVMGVSEAAAMVESGDVRLLATSSPERLDDTPDTPALVEEGIDYEFDIWRGVMGPAELSDEHVAYYEDVLGEMVETDDWRTETENLGWEDSFMESEEFGVFLDETYEDSVEVLEDVGLIEDED